MGVEIDRDTFADEEYTRFGQRLRQGLQALGRLLDRPEFGAGAPSLGAELELSLIDPAGRPALVNRRVLAEAVDPRVTLELDRFNLEFNATPVPLAGSPLTALGHELRAALASLDVAAAEHDARVVGVGILPTLELRDLQRPAMSELTRYRALNRGLQRLRQRPFRIHIEGADERVEVECDDVTPEGANTSLQLHLRVAPADYARTYNAAQIATAPALALAGNSPFFLGRSLWQETRIALFKQAVDDRPHASVGGWPPARVGFGHGWVRSGIHELFTEVSELYAPLIPVLSDDDDPLAVLARGELPELFELRLHNSTVWRWNRPVYDTAASGHVRIEFRALPAGPTVTDMQANAAFLLGLTLGLAPDADALVTRLPFAHAQHNFYRAAQHGLDAELLWPSAEPPSPRPIVARELILQLLPTARAGLDAAGIDRAESEPLLEIIRERVEGGQTGARWQVATAQALRRRGATSERLFADLVERYLTLQRSDEPVHRWPVGG
jgi:gamma-glutamyl:cysteine ligase YbdK (ATP-grasp superfamily)